MYDTTPLVSIAPVAVACSLPLSVVIVAVVGHCARSYSGGHPESVNPASWAAVVAAIAIAMVITASVMPYILASIVPYIPMSVVPYIPMSVVPYVPANVMTPYVSAKASSGLSRENSGHRYEE